MKTSHRVVWIACMLMALAGCQKFSDTPVPKTSSSSDGGAAIQGPSGQMVR